jgi:hypothetical protein
MACRSLSAAILTAACLLLAGCEVVALSVDTGTGLIVVRFEDDGRSGSDPWRMRVRQAGQPERIVAVGPGAPLELTLPATGPVELTLLVPPGCSTLTPNPRTIQPSEAASVTATFSVRCTRS